MTNDTELTVLKTLYRLTAEAICEEQGHRWRELKPVKQPDATSADPIMTTGLKRETCLRCGAVHTRTANSASTTEGDFTISTGD